MYVNVGKEEVGEVVVVVAQYQRCQHKGVVEEERGQLLILVGVEEENQFLTLVEEEEGEGEGEGG